MLGAVEVAPVVFGEFFLRTKYTAGDLSLIVPGAQFTTPPIQPRTAEAIAQDLPSAAHTAPVKHKVLRKLLLDLEHPNKAFVEYVCDGLRDGFGIGVAENTEGFHLDNAKSVREWESKVDDWLESERSAGRLLGPFTSATLPHPRVQISPLGTAHKKSYDPDVVKRRVIYNLSAGPDGDHEQSVNGSTYQDPSLAYDTIGDAATVLRRFGREAHLAKTDAEAAFRQVPLHPSAYHRMGVQWRGEIYLDTRVPFGLRMAPFIYTSLSDAVRFVVQTTINRSLGEDQAVVLSLIDDFLIIGRSKEITHRAHTILLETFRDLNLPFVEEKTEGARQAIEFLGAWFSRPTGAGWHVGLPEDKFLDLSRELSTMSRLTNSVRRVKLLSLAGKLGFGHAIMPEMRPRVSEMFLLAHSGGGYNPKHWVHTTKALRDDCRAWLDYMGGNAPTRPIDRPPQVGQTTVMTGDASGALGCGAFTDTEYFMTPWSARLVAGSLEVSSTLQELFCGVLAFLLWSATAHQGNHFEYHTDNANTLHELRRGRSPIRPINSLLIGLCRVCVARGVTIAFVWASREVPEQKCADALSRCDAQGFEQAFEAFRLGVTPQHLHIPDSLVKEVLSWLRWSVEPSAQA